jgi:hypothetical protein
MATDKPKVPKQSKGDVAHALAKAGLSIIPIVGSPAAELFQLIIQPPLEKRRGEFMTQVGEKLQELEAKGIKLEELQKKRRVCVDGYARLTDCFENPSRSEAGRITQRNC